VGVLWNRCLRNLAVGLLQEFSATVASSNSMDLDDETNYRTCCIDHTLCSKFFRKCFTQFNEENLSTVEEEIHTIGLKNLIASDTLGGFPISPAVSSSSSRNPSLNCSSSLLKKIFIQAAL